ncbi:MAG TPA: hypothetical protein VJ654_07625 [Noviherbaspirillum sp.]|nr:hypothetical protein [Noviherbaspirillum sp.]
MNNSHTTLCIPEVSSKETSKGRLYALTIPKDGDTHSQHIDLDREATRLLREAQHLEQLKSQERLLSRTVLIRRAVQVYCGMLTDIAAGKAPQLPELQIERELMLWMSRSAKTTA